MAPTSASRRIVMICTPVNRFFMRGFRLVCALVPSGAKQHTIDCPPGIVSKGGQLMLSGADKFRLNEQFVLVIQAINVTFDIFR
jgi:hypothetical protein